MLIDRFFCALILDLGIYISWKLVQRFFDSQTACFFLLIAITCLPLYLYTMYFYTDTAVIAFPVLMLYLWYLYARNGKQRYMILLGLTLGVGVLIRPNLILFLPALAIYMFFTLKWRKVLLNLALIGLLMIVLSTGAQQIERHFGYQHDPALNMPTLHWIMLGLSHDGGYNHRDYRLTRLQTTPMLKKKADRQQIAKRIQAYGIRGLIRIWGIKAARTYGVGAHGYYWYTHSSAHPTEAYQYLFNRKNQVTIYIIQIFYVVHLILLLLSVLRSFRIKAADLNLLIQICLLGNFIFYVFVWEAEPRYSLLFTPFILLGALFGFKELELRISTCSIWNKHGALSRQRLQAAVVITLLTAVSLGGLAGMYAVTEAHSPQRYYIVDQRYKVGKGGIQVDARHSVAQTFQATGPFNRISFGVLKNRRHAKYRFVLSEARSGHALFAKTFAPRYRQPVQTFRIAHGGIKGKKQITITQLHGNKGASLTLAINGSGYEQRDLYPGGFLSQNGILKERKDLQFAVYRIAKGAYLSKTAYGLLLALPVMMLLWYAYVSLVMNQHEIKANSLEMNKTEKSTD
nr:glycosyltransferase family 39 protein [Sporolactobacillus mangiferae]